MPLLNFYNTKYYPRGTMQASIFDTQENVSIRVRVESFTAYQESSPGNSSASAYPGFESSDVDIGVGPFYDGVGYARVGYTDSTEYLDYEVQIDIPGEYAIHVFGATGIHAFDVTAQASIEITSNVGTGNEATTSAPCPYTDAGWSAFQHLRSNSTLPLVAGTNTFRVRSIDGVDWCFFDVVLVSPTTTEDAIQLDALASQGPPPIEARVGTIEGEFETNNGLPVNAIYSIIDDTGQTRSNGDPVEFSGDKARLAAIPSRDNTYRRLAIGAFFETPGTYYFWAFIKTLAPELLVAPYSDALYGYLVSSSDAVQTGITVNNNTLTDSTKILIRHGRDFYYFSGVASNNPITITVDSDGVGYRKFDFVVRCSNNGGIPLGVSLDIALDKYGFTKYPFAAFNQVALPTIGSSFAAQPVKLSTLNASIPAVSADISAIGSSNTLESEIPPVSADIAGQRVGSLALDAEIPTPSADVAGNRLIRLTLDAAIPAIGADFDAEAPDNYLSAVLVPISAQISAVRAYAVNIGASIPPVGAEFTAANTRLNTAKLNSSLPPFSLRAQARWRYSQAVEVVPESIRDPGTITYARTQNIRFKSLRPNIQSLLLFSNLVPSSVIPFLAWEWGLSGYKGWHFVEDADRQTQLNLVNDAYQLHSSTGQLGGHQAIIELAGGSLRSYIAPPDKPYFGLNWTTEERQQWLSYMPQLRTFRYDRRAPVRGFFLNEEYLSDDEYKSFPIEGDAIERVLERSRIAYPNGNRVDLQTYTRNVEFTELSTTRTVQFVKQGNGAGFFCGDPISNGPGVAPKYKSYLLTTPAANRFYSVNLPPQGYVDFDETLTAEIISPGLTPIDVKFTMTYERDTKVGMFLNDFYFIPKHETAIERDEPLDYYCFSYTTARLRVYRTVYLYDPESPLDIRDKATAFLGAFRLGMPAYHAQIRVELLGKSPIDAVGVSPGFVSGFFVESDKTRYWDLVKGMGEYSYVRDKILLTTKTRNFVQYSRESRWGEFKWSEYQTIRSP